MVSFFWQRGFYYNRRFFFFTDYSFFAVRTVPGLSFFFWKLYALRCEGFSGLFERPTAYRLPVYSARYAPMAGLSTDHRYLLTHMLIRLYPVLLNLYDQARLNVVFFFFTRTYRGFALKFARPLYRRTRGRTYYRKHLKKPPGRHYLRVTTSSWF